MNGAKGAPGVRGRTDSPVLQVLKVQQVPLVQLLLGRELSGRQVLQECSAHKEIQEEQEHVVCLVHTDFKVQPGKIMQLPARLGAQDLQVP